MKTPSIFAAVLLAASAANAQSSPDMSMTKQAATASAVMTAGVVQSVDKSRGVVTLKHGEIANMDMPAMTMGFNVADEKMLDNLKPGDNVRFRVENVKGAPTVIRMEAAK